VHHIVKVIKQHGPVHSWWMYVYERFNSWICQRVKNRRHPEVNVMETYRVNIYTLCLLVIAKNVFAFGFKIIEQILQATLVEDRSGNWLIVKYYVYNIIF